MTVAKDGVIDTTDELLSQVEHFQQVIKSFFDQPLPDACEALIYRCDVANQNGSYLSSFERYAARLLRYADAGSLRKVFSQHEIGVGRLSVTGMCWMSFDSDVLSSDERRVVLACESVINRLILLFKSSLDAQGIAALSANDSEGYCMDKDWEVFASVGREVDAFAASMQDENPLQVQHGLVAPKGGEWDTRTRFARMMESIVSPYRIEYRFDAQVDRGLFEIHVLTIPSSVLPPKRDGGTLSVFTDSSAEGQKIALSYALRLSVFIASAAFFSNVAISHVVVTTHAEGVRGKAVTSLYFERMPFLVNALPSLKLGDLVSDETMGNPLSCVRLLSPTEARFACDEDGNVLPIEPLRIDFDERRFPVWEDERPLPEAMRDLLHADRVCDLDVMRIEDAAKARMVTEASLEADSYPMASLAVFEGVLASLSGFEIPLLGAASSDGGVEQISKEGEGNPMLFCQDEVSRVLVGLVDRGRSRFEKCPDYVFVSNQKAAKVNSDLGDDDAARTLYQRGIDLAPTSPTSYIDKACFELEKGSPDAAVQLLCKALLFSFRPVTVEYAYYRLAFALYKAGRLEASIAVYALVVRGCGRFSRQAAVELKQILENAGRTEVPTREQALERMRHEEIPEAPSPFVSTQVIRALFGLVEADCFVFASSLCSALSEASKGPDRDILDAVATSFSEGVSFDCAE